MEIRGGVGEDGGADEVADAAVWTCVSDVRWKRGVKLPTEI